MVRTGAPSDAVELIVVDTAGVIGETVRRALMRNWLTVENAEQARVGGGNDQ